jgi:hypothetical protein
MAVTQCPSLVSASPRVALDAAYKCGALSLD